MLPTFSSHSGSTGRPKGCLATLSSLTSYCLGKNTAHAVSRDSTVFIASSHTFDPSYGDALATLVAGGVIAIAPRAATFQALGSCLAATRATHTCTTPALFNTLHSTATEANSWTPDRLPLLQVVALGGEPMGVDVVDKWAESVQLLNTYGVTECCVYQTISRVPHDVGHPLFRKRLGEPIGENRILLMRSREDNGGRARFNEFDPESMVPVFYTTIIKPNGQSQPHFDPRSIGEIWISGPQVGPGYLKRPDFTSARFIEHKDYGRCFRTGDLAARATFESQAGRGESIVFLGRSDTQIKVNGQRVEVEEIEQMLLKATSINGVALLEDVVVVLNSGMKILVAYCVPKELDVFVGDCSANDPSRSDGSEAVLIGVLRHVAQLRLPRHMVPSRFIVASQLPQTTTGKKARMKLSQEELPLIPFPVADGCGDDEVDHGGWCRIVSAVWSDVLGTSFFASARLPNTFHFAELGGDSLKALKVVRRLKDLWEAEVRSRDPEGHAPTVDAGEFGENLTDFAPGELLKRPLLGEYAYHLFSAFGTFDNAASDSSTSPNRKPYLEENPPSPVVSLLFRASALGRWPLVPVIVALLPTSLNFPPRAMNPLHAACLGGHTSTVKLLLDTLPAASPSLPDATGATPLHLACQHGPIELISLLLSAISPFKHTSATASPTLTRQHLSALTRKDDFQQTPLHHAARSNAPAAVLAHLLRILPGSEHAPRDVYGRTPLHWAVVNGHLGCVKVLVEAGTGDVGAFDKAGETAREMAERRARCGAAERGAGRPASVFGAIAALVGGSGGTASLKKYAKK
ncbi:hypothetical protein DFJ73DRAFT_384404 [Zopfochytrium polystomum]|nr:hypothetical protein DFJ73DRAFT_384404 [Zopfochytrium polystomum]